MDPNKLYRYAPFYQEKRAMEVSEQSTQNAHHLYLFFFFFFFKKKASHTTNNLAQVFTFSIRRLVHDMYTRQTIKTSDSDTIHPVLKASMSSSSFDAVVPDILTFRPDKDDPLDSTFSHQDNVVSAVTGKSKVHEDRKKKRMELISAVVSAIISWQVSDAFEKVCSEVLGLDKCVDHHISYGIKG
jgi:hypothetical protein